MPRVGLQSVIVAFLVHTNLFLHAQSPINTALFYEVSKTTKRQECLFKAVLSVTFDFLILEIKLLFFKNTVKILKFR